MATVEHDELTGSEGTGPWPAFADLLSATTLLFLVLFAAIAVPALVESGGKKSALQQIYRALLPEDGKEEVSVRPVGDYLLVTIEGDATFPLRSADLSQMKPEGKRILSLFGSRLLSDSAILRSIDQIQVVGHTSSEGADSTNWRLSASRAAAVSLFLIDSVGLPPCRISALGRSRYYPVDPAAAKQQRRVDARDRRIELEIRPTIPGDLEQERKLGSCIDMPSDP